MCDVCVRMVNDLCVKVSCLVEGSCLRAQGCEF
jgi:hypothetical protein